MNNQWDKEKNIFGESFPELRKIKYEEKFLYIFDQYRWSVPFEINKEDVFTEEEILRVFNFAFKSKEFHRSNRSGGTLKRDPIQIFFNIFLGKLGEVATYNYLLRNNIKLKNEIDYEIKGHGEWDDCDIITENNKKISVKSSKYYSNMLLLEKKDYNENGELEYNIGTDKTYNFDYFSYVRIAPVKLNVISKFGYGGTFKNNTPYVEKALKSFILNYKWHYEEPFILSKELFLNIAIKNKYFIEKNILIKFDHDEKNKVLLKLSSKINSIEKINEYIKDVYINKSGFIIDADNYYFPLKYMNKISKINI